jgi:hypothetical protein
MKPRICVRLVVDSWKILGMGKMFAAKADVGMVNFDMLTDIRSNSRTTVR